LHVACAYGLRLLQLLLLTGDEQPLGPDLASAPGHESLSEARLDGAEQPEDEAAADAGHVIDSANVIRGLLSHGLADATQGDGRTQHQELQNTTNANSLRSRRSAPKKSLLATFRGRAKID
jgi:hypothetical protein